ncbi:MAG: hypothetical protein ABSG21_08890 [Spirochaetia bacterium]
MGRHHAAPRALLAMLMIFSVGAALFADPINLPQPEAPTSIFATKLGSVDVDLNLLGSWTAAASLGGGLLFAPGQPVQTLDAFPSLDTGFVFTQTPDITASLEIMKRFFLSASIIGSFANNYIQMGYRGGPGEVLRSVVLGTQGITIPASTLMQIPSQPQGSLGAMAQLKSGGSTNDLLLRWDATLPKTKTFIGKNELVEQETPVNGYLRGMYFYLPDTGLDPGTLQVFIEDPTGTYFSNESPVPRKYRLATYNDVVLDSTQGLVMLLNPVHGRVLAFYKKGGSPVGTTGTATLPKDVGGVAPRDPGNSQAFNWNLNQSYPMYLGLDMTHRKVTLSGLPAACLLLWEPGDNSPFEIESSYAFSANPPTDVSKINIKLNSKNAALPLPPTPIFQPDPPNKRFLVLQNQTVRSTFYNFYPFPDPTGLIYGPDRDSLSGGLAYDIYVQMLTPVSDYVLEANIEPGSVQVTINGVAETRFDMEPVSGKVTLHVDVLPTDRIEVTYRKADAGVSGGDILFAWRDSIPLSDATTLSLSAGVRWNANPWTYSQVPYSKSGTVIATAGIDGKTDNLEYSAQAGASYTNPDTTGILRLFGMEGNSINVDLSEDNAYPASLPDPTEIPSLTQANRGLLYYRDYRTYGALGSSSLQTIETTPPPSQMPYISGNRMGPYNVTGSDGNIDPVSLVFEYNLAASNNWVGAQIPVSAGSDVDLSNARAITIRLRAGTGPLPMSGNVNVYLQIGSVSEDLDGSGVLKAKVSTTDIGFTFVQPNPAVTLEVGAGPQLKGNGKLDSEDRNGNGILDLEDPNRVVTPLSAPFPIGSGTLSGSWQNFTYALNDSDRQKLLQARSVRIIIVASGGAATGEVLVDSITIEGTPFWPQVTSPDVKTSVHLQEVSENIAQKPPSGGDLPSRFPDTYNRFHPNGELNEVLETVWSGMTLPFTVQGFIPQGTSDDPQGTGGIQYQTVVSYIRADTAGMTYTFSMLDSSSHGMVWSVAVSDNTWHEVKFSRKNNTVTVDGSNLGTPIQFDSSYGSLAQLKVTVSGPALGLTGPGHLYIDEVYLTDPKSVFGGALIGSLSAKFPGTVMSAGKTPILSNVALRQDVALYSAGFAPLYGVPYAAEDLSSRSHVDSDLLFARTSLDLTLRDQGGSLSAAGGHRVTVPNGGSPMSVTDAFSLSTTGGFTREDAVALTAGPVGSLSVDASANASPDETDTSGLLTQTWLAGLTLTPLPPFGISSTLSLSQAVTGYPLAQEWYGARWATETGLLLPWQGGGDVTRAEKLGFKAGIPAAPLGVTLEGETDASGSNYSSSGFTQESDLTTALSFLYKLGQGDSGESVGLSYRRALSLTTTPAPGPRFQQETDELSRILSLQSYFLEGIPLLEIFSDNTGKVLPAWQSATQGTYSPSIDLSYQRSYGSRLRDLFIPSSVDLAVGQDLKMTQDLTETVTYVRPKISMRAVNLFGKLGSTPLLPMVLTDDYSLSLNASVDTTTPPLYPQYGSGPILSHFSVQAQASLTGENNNQLTLVETLRWDQVSSIVLSNDAQALLEWRVMPAAGIPLPLLPPNVGATGRFEHRESAEVTVGYQDLSTFHPFTLLLGHATSLVYPGHGSIKGSLNLGMDVQDLPGEGLAWRFAFRAALEAKLTF